MQSAYFGRWAKGLTRSMQERLSWRFEVRFVGWLIERLGVGVTVSGIGKAKTRE